MAHLSLEARYGPPPPALPGGLCRNLPHLDWFPSSRVGTAGLREQAICATCPVRQPCFDYGVANPEQDGIWGGLTQAQRRKVARSLYRAACPACGSRQVQVRTGVQLCLACGVTWPIRTRKEE